MTLNNHYAWTQLDGSTMVGKMIERRPTFNGDYLERIDGTRCYVASEKLRPATMEDFDSAVSFFANIGKEFAQ